MAILIPFIAIDTDIDAKLVLDEKVDHLIGQHRGVGSQSKCHRTTPLLPTTHRILCGRTDGAEVEQGFTTEEGDGDTVTPL